MLSSSSSTLSTDRRRLKFWYCLYLWVGSGSEARSWSNKNQLWKYHQKGKRYRLCIRKMNTDVRDWFGWGHRKTCKKCPRSPRIFPYTDSCLCCRLATLEKIRVRKTCHHTTRIKGTRSRTSPLWSIFSCWITATRSWGMWSSIGWSKNRIRSTQGKMNSTLYDQSRRGTSNTIHIQYSRRKRI